MKKSTIKSILISAIADVNAKEIPHFDAAVFQTMRLFGINNKETARIWIKYYRLKRKNKSAFSKLITELSNLIHKRIKPMASSKIERMLMEYRQMRLCEIRKSIKVVNRKVRSTKS